MKNLILSGLLLFGGIILSLRTHKTQGIILMLTLLLIVSATIFINLYKIDIFKSTENIEQYGDAPAPDKDYKLDKLTEAEAKALTNDAVKKIQGEILKIKDPLEKKLKELNLKNNLSADEQNEKKELTKQKVTLDDNLNLIKIQYTTRFADTEGVDASDQACKLILKFPPAPSFNKISGRASDNVIDQIKFENLDGLVSESGVSSGGTEFTYKCPNGSKIVAYDYNNDPKVDNKIIDSASIFGGIGPVYCSDGSRLSKTWGKTKSQTISRRPADTGLSTYDYILPNGFDDTLPGDSLSGSIKGVNVDTCGKVCTAMGQSCNTTSFVGANNDNGNCYFSRNRLDNSFNGTEIKDSRIYAKEIL